MNRADVRGHHMTGLQRQRAEYIERMVRELSRLAAGAELTLLSYLLDMAAEEAALTRGLEPLPATPLQGEGTRVPRKSNGAT